MPLKSSLYTEIDPDHLAASAGFPFYGIGWTEKDGRYPWDGSLKRSTRRGSETFPENLTNLQMSSVP